jgi:hypothetical protein
MSSPMSCRYYRSRDDADCSDDADAADADDADTMALLN